MPSDSSSSETRRLTKSNNPEAAGAPPPPEQEHLPCPRCDSTNTKFCYYNNYNFSQPRHFCKSCRRYWTHGGTLRDIPVGGGTRKNAKRSRTANSGGCGTMMNMMNCNVADHNLPLPATPVLVPLMGNNQGGSLPFGISGDGKGNNPVCGSFTSLLNTQGPGFLALGGFGLGLSTGFDQEIGFGLGRGVWPFPGVGDGGAGVGGGGHGGGGGGAGMGNTWQFENGENGFVGGDCFSWPDLAISTPGNGLK